LNDYLVDEFPWSMAFDEVSISGWLYIFEILIVIIQDKMTKEYHTTDVVKILIDNIDVLKKYNLMDKVFSDIIFQKYIISNFKNDENVIKSIFTEVKIGEDVINEYPWITELDTYYDSKELGLL